MPAVRVRTIRKSGPAPASSDALPLEEVGVPERLRGGEHDGQIARVLVDLGIARLALLLELLEPRHDDGHELEDDRRRDVRHDPEREDRELRERAAGEEVQQAEHGAALAAEVILDRLRVDARRRNPRAEPVDGEDQRREEDAVAQLGDAPGVGEPGEHLARPPRRPAAPRSAALVSAASSSALRLLRRLSASASAPPAASGLRLPALRLLRLRLAAEPGDRPAGLLDLLARARREEMRRDGELLRQVAVAEDLDVEARVPDQPGLLSSSGVTSPSKRSRSRTLTAETFVRCGPIGIASFEYGPRCLPRRM